MSAWGECAWGVRVVTYRNQRHQIFEIGDPYRCQICNEHSTGGVFSNTQIFGGIGDAIVVGARGSQ